MCIRDSVSATQLTATGTATSAGTFAVSVVNPDPGSADSNSVNLLVNSTSNTSACGAIGLGQGASLNGFIPFPAENAWNTDISGAQVDPNSSAIINFIGPGIVLHPDFGSGEYNGSSIGIPYVVVGSGQAFVPIDFTAYGDESDPGPMPVPSDAPIEEMCIRDRIMTLYEFPELCREARNAGALGFVQKADSGRCLIPAVRCLAERCV